MSKINLLKQNYERNQKSRSLWLGRGLTAEGQEGTFRGDGMVLTEVVLTWVLTNVNTQ